MASDGNLPDLGTLTAVIARSEIVIAAPRSMVQPFPSGFNETDIAILEWIAAEGRRAGRRLTWM